MKRTSWLLCSTTLTLALLASCETSKPATDVSASAGTNAPVGSTSTNAESMESNGIRLTPLSDSPKYPEAQMQLRNPIGGATIPSGDVPFDYQITNFQLTKMSGGPNMAQMANSAKGQHIHNIVDNDLIPRTTKPASASRWLMGSTRCCRFCRAPTTKA